MNDSEDFFTCEKRFETLYAEGRQLFRKGDYEEAMSRFKRIYEDSVIYRDVAQIIDDYYTTGEEAWRKKYRMQFGDSNDLPS